MKTIGKALAVIIIVSLIVGGSIGFFVGAYFEKIKVNDVPAPETVEEVVHITKEDVKSELKSIEEISSYEGKYTVKKSVDESKYAFDYAVPGTKNTINIQCSGIVKMGYNFNDIGIKVDDISKKIYIRLPEVKVNDNYIDVDSIKCTEDNNILNKINFAQYKTLFIDIENLGLKDVESKNIREKAETNMKRLINSTLSKFDGYEIVYM